MRTWSWGDPPDRDALPRVGIPREEGPNAVVAVVPEQPSQHPHDYPKKHNMNENQDGIENEGKNGREKKRAENRY